MNCKNCNESTSGRCDLHLNHTPHQEGEEKCKEGYAKPHLCSLLHCNNCGNCLEENKNCDCPLTTNVAPTTQSWSDDFDMKWGKCGAGLFEPAYPRDIASKKRIKSFISQTLATALKEQEEKLVKALEAITFNGDDDTYLRGNRDGIKEAITLIKSTK